MNGLFPGTRDVSLEAAWNGVEVKLLSPIATVILVKARSDPPPNKKKLLHMKKGKRRRKKKRNFPFWMKFHSKLSPSHGTGEDTASMGETPVFDPWWIPCGRWSVALLRSAWMCWGNAVIGGAKVAIKYPETLASKAGFSALGLSTFSQNKLRQQDSYLL